MQSEKCYGKNLYEKVEKIRVSSAIVLPIFDGHNNPTCEGKN